MGYMHIDNLYKSQDILLFKRCYALEKVHGTSAHVSYVVSNGALVNPKAALRFFAGGEKHERFVSLFDPTVLLSAFGALGHKEVTVYGEAYGGKQQGMKEVYGPELKFIAFDVKVGEMWLSVLDAAQVASGLGMEFVPFDETATDLGDLDALRDAPSVVAGRRGMGSDKPREGIVLRPLIEVTKNNGSRIIAKHKLEAFSERTTPQKIVDPAQLVVLANADAIAQEWVTPMRLDHVLQRVQATQPSDTPKVIGAMIEDIFREAKNEIVESKEAKAAIGRRTAQLFKQRMTQVKAS